MCSCSSLPSFLCPGFHGRLGHAGRNARRLGHAATGSAAGLGRHAGRPAGPAAASGLHDWRLHGRSSAAAPDVAGGELCHRPDEARLQDRLERVGPGRAAQLARRSSSPAASTAVGTTVGNARRREMSEWNQELANYCVIVLVAVQRL